MSFHEGAAGSARVIVPWRFEASSYTAGSTLMLGGGGIERGRCDGGGVGSARASTLRFALGGGGGSVVRSAFVGAGGTTESEPKIAGVSSRAGGEAGVVVASVGAGAGVGAGLDAGVAGVSVAARGAVAAGSSANRRTVSTGAAGAFAASASVGGVSAGLATGAASVGLATGGALVVALVTEVAGRVGTDNGDSGGVDRAAAGGGTRTDGVPAGGGIDTVFFGGDEVERTGEGVPNSGALADPPLSSSSSPASDGTFGAAGTVPSDGGRTESSVGSRTAGMAMLDARRVRAGGAAAMNTSTFEIERSGVQCCPSGESSSSGVILPSAIHARSSPLFGSAARVPFGRRTLQGRYARSGSVEGAADGWLEGNADGCADARAGEPGIGALAGGRGPGATLGVALAPAVAAPWARGSLSFIGCINGVGSTQLRSGPSRPSSESRLSLYHSSALSRCLAPRCEGHARRRAKSRFTAEREAPFTTGRRTLHHPTTVPTQ